MKIKRRIRFPVRFGDERGQALIIVLILLVLGTATIIPVLAQVGTALDTGALYEAKTENFYAADSGVEDGIWQIKFDQLDYIFAGQGYSPYDYTSSWSYELDEPVNDLSPTVSIENVWIPYGITPLSNLTEVRDAFFENKLLVSGTADVTSYDIFISFYPDTEAGDNLTINSVGIWLPYGFTYDEGSSNLEALDVWDPCYAEPAVYDHAGGQAIVWTLDDSPPLSDFPTYVELGGVQTIKISFDYTPAEAETTPAAISWIETDDYPTIEDILPVMWDIDTKVYKITSVANEATVEAYAARTELRDMNDAIAGDYVAIGNSLMQNNYSPYGIRDTLLSESSSTASSNPSDGVAILAYLYWAGWVDENTVLEEDCGNFWENDWDDGDDWGTYYGRYYAHSSQDEGHPDRYLASKSLDLSGMDEDAVVEVRWNQWDGGSLESGDVLVFDFSADGGDTWVGDYIAFADDIDNTSLRFSYEVPSEFWTDQFRLRFYIQGFSGYGEYVYLDDIAVTWYVPAADQSVEFKINGNQVYLDGEGTPTQGFVELTAGEDDWSYVDNLRGYSYACKVDITALVQAFSENGSVEDLDGNGNATYTVGNVSGDLGDQLSWAGWSLVIVYASPETAGHRLYLFDRFSFTRGYDNLDFDYDGEPGGDIDGFIIPEPIEGDPDPNAGKLTCFVGEGDNFIEGDNVLFTGQSGYSMQLSNAVSPQDNVWNMNSPGMTFDGVDVDTFDIPWENGSSQPLVEPGDTSAHLDLNTDADAWNLIYLILSVRSETTTGGTTHYVIYYN